MGILGGERFASAGSDPISILQEGARRIMESTGGARPLCILLPASLPRRMLEDAERRLELARRVLGVGVDEHGRLRTNGILWSARGGRRSKKRNGYLRQTEILPAQIAKMREALEAQKANPNINMDHLLRMM